MIVKDIERLRIPSEPVEDIEEGRKIAEMLFEELSKHPHGVGLAAPQIGIHKRVVVVNVKEPIYLINPEIIDSDDETPFIESCLSFPGQEVKTLRNVWVSVKADIAGRIGDEYENAKIMFGPNEDFHIEDENLLESIVVQHEIGLLDGKLMWDFKLVSEPLKAGTKFGRNDMIAIVNPDTGERKTGKYKKLKSFIDSGWAVQ